MATLRARIETEVLPTDGPNPKNRVQCRHLDRRFLYDLCAHPTITGKATSLLGPDLVLWATYFFIKEPGGSEIPWHNACVNLIPGSHKKIIPHVRSRDGMAFGEEADPALVDSTNAIPMELQPGQFFLFNERTLHQSNKNTSQKRRMGMTMRITVPFVKITHDLPPLFPGHANILLCGEDKLGFNRLAEPPKENA
jgi:ectoine hydroxylase-related dioxygenase (phytanoyl-CoA dioxygenase family)